MHIFFLITRQQCIFYHFPDTYIECCIIGMFIKALKKYVNITFTVHRSSDHQFIFLKLFSISFTEPERSLCAACTFYMRCHFSVRCVSFSHDSSPTSVTFYVTCWHIWEHCYIWQCIRKSVSITVIFGLIFNQDVVDIRKINLY